MGKATRMSSQPCSWKLHLTLPRGCMENGFEYTLSLMAMVEPRECGYFGSVVATAFLSSCPFGRGPIWDTALLHS